MSVSFHRLGVFLLFVLLSSVLFAQEKTQAYYNSHENEIIPDAQISFNKGDYNRALELCKWHYIIVGNHSADQLQEKAEKCARLIQEALSLHANGQQEAAFEKAQTLLALNPEDQQAMELMLSRESTVVQEQVAYGSIKVTSNPYGASVILDGEVTELTTPDILENVSPGKHKISLVLEGYTTYNEDLTISSNQRINLSISLKQKPNTTNPTPNLSPIGYSIGHEWVDLGLSVKWATCNLGANSPQDVGDYFSWAEVYPKNVYSPENYKFSNRKKVDSFRKYGTIFEYGKVDNKIRLDTYDDAARVNWGGPWRLPTLEEQQELIEKCIWTWTQQKGQNGYLVTSKVNGNSIFLLSSGGRFMGDGTYQKGDRGLYWSSSLNYDFPFLAFSIVFSTDTFEISSNHRAYGCTIRPVWD